MSFATDLTAKILYLYWLWIIDRNRLHAGQHHVLSCE